MDIRNTAWRRLRVIVAIALVCLIGDLRTPVPAVASSAAVPASRAVRSQSAAQPVAALQTIRSDVRNTDPALRDEANDVRLVPAIYAWDPDVRFVYYRHVSKWM